MSICRVLVAVLLCSLAACADGPADELHEATGYQEVQPLPNCPVGVPYVFWTEPFGSCGDCRVSQEAGQPEHKFAACSGDIDHTTRMIQNLCTTPCELQ